VIKDTLRVSSLAPTSLSLEEGDALTLILKASSDTVQRTNLSVTWYLQPDGEKHPHPIVSLDRGLTQSPGPRFRERYAAGDVQLVKVDEATYQLNISKVKLSDQGEVYCQAVEWIVGPDGNRHPISWKQSKTTYVTVKRKGELPHIVYWHRDGLNVTAWTPRIVASFLTMIVSDSKPS
jgi:hypothetical protein